MNLRIMGVYRETEFSPDKVAEDAAILDAVLAELHAHGAEIVTAAPERFVADSALTGNAGRPPAMVLAMCQGEQALARLAGAEEVGAVVLNSALAIRNCYRDLLGAGLMRAGVPVPEGALVTTASPIDMKPLRALDLSLPMYVKRGDLHALGPHDVRRVEGLEQLEATLLRFNRRGVRTAYVQQEAVGNVVKFYGVSGGEYFAAVPEHGHVTEAQNRSLHQAAALAAAALGLEVWGGDAIVRGESIRIVDFNDWPSFSRVREEAARAIARRALMLLRRDAAARDLNL